MISKKEEHVKGLVVSANPYQENSSLVRVCTQNGIQDFLVKGVYRPNSRLKPFLLAFNFLDIDYCSSDTGLLFAKDCEVIKDISKFYTDFRMNAVLSFLQEATVTFFRYGDSYPLEDVLLFLDALEGKKDLLSLLLLLIGSFYRSHGLELETGHCLVCHTTHDLVSYSIPDGGFYCRKCTKDERKDSMELYILKFCFLGFSSQNVQRVVPKDKGKKILIELINNLTEYFDTTKLSSLPLLLQLLD